MNDRVFDEVLRECLEGRLSLAEARERLKRAGPDSGQAGLLDQLERLERALEARVEEQGDLPWLGMRVMTHIEARERAKSWLKNNPGGLLTHGRPGLRVLALGGAARVWTLLGAALAGGCAGYYLWGQLPLSGSEQGVAGIAGSLFAAMAGGLCAVFAVLAVHWSESREYPV